MPSIKVTEFERRQLSVSRGILTSQLSRDLDQLSGAQRGEINRHAGAPLLK
jgi:hypothetical protein